MGQSANVCDVAPHDRHGRNIGTSGTSVEARTESPCCVRTYELEVWPNYRLSGGLMGQDARARGKAAMVLVLVLVLVLLAKDVVSLQINTEIGKS